MARRASPGPLRPLAWDGARLRRFLDDAAHGLTSAEIAVRLGVAPRTIDFRRRNIIAKRGAPNRHEAIARGISAGLIRIEI